MIAWIKHFLFDEAFFKRTLRSLLALVGMGMQAGVIPTGIEGGGKYGALFVALAFFIGGTMPKKV